MKYTNLINTRIFLLDQKITIEDNPKMFRAAEQVVSPRWGQATKDYLYPLLHLYVILELGKWLRFKQYCLI